MNPASVLDRLSAQIVDLCFLFLISFGISVYLGVIGTIFSLALSLIYFWLCHQFGGQTLGKKLIGLRVISVHSQSLNILRTLGRETVGRALCLGTAFLGYFGILFRKDGRGLHDIIAGSIVISEKRLHASVSRFVGVLLALIVTLSISAYYMLFKTPLLATVGMHLLHEQGMGVDSLSGSLESGWNIKTFYGSNPAFSFNIKGINIKHDKSGFYQSGAWHLKEISIDEIKVRLAPQVLNFNYFDKGLVSNNLHIPTSHPYSFLNLKALVDVLKIKKLTISEDKKLNLTLADLDLNKITYQANTVSVEGVHSGKTSPNKLDISQLIYNVSEKTLLLKAKLFTKKEVYSFLKSDLQASLTWSGPLHQPERFRFVTFEDRLSMDFFRKDLLISLHGFYPAKYIKAYPTLKNFNVKLRNSNCSNIKCLQSLQGSGSFYISSQKVDFKNNLAGFVGINEEVLPFNYNDVVNALFAPAPILSIVSEETLSNFVSQLYFKKPMDALLAQEQEMVKRDEVYFRVLRERFDPNRPKHIDTFLLRSPSEMSEAK